MTEDFRTRLIRALDSEESQCRRELARYRQAGEQEDLMSFARGTLRAVDLLRRGCGSADDFLAIMAAQSELVSRYCEAYSEPSCDSRTRLTYVWHSGCFIELDLIAQRLKIYARQ